MAPCNVCLQDKPEEFFSRNKSKKSGKNTTCKPCHKLYVKDHYNTNKARYKDNFSRYAATHRKELSAYSLLWWNHEGKTDPLRRLKGNLRARLRMALKYNNKTGSAVSDLGCSITDFRSWISSQFTDGMTWENYGDIWELDHIIPLCTFDLSVNSEIRKACHWFNLRPLSVSENRARKNPS